MTADFDAALRLIVSRSSFLCDELGLAWDRSDTAVIGAAGLLRDRCGSESSGPVVTAIVGGASAGKSTLFNNIIDASNASRVGIRAHTTVGPIVGVGETDAEAIGLWSRRHGFLGGLREREAAGPGTAGDESLLTVVDTNRLAGSVVIDTPDFTSIASRDSGDLTRAMLAWFDRVIVVVDEDRWYDEQVFGWLRRQLDALAIDRFVVFNRCQRGEAVGAPLSDIERQRLRDQAEVMGGDHLLLEHMPGVGFVRLAETSRAALREWVVRPMEFDSISRRRDRLVALASERAREALDGVRHRSELIEQLERVLEEERGSLSLKEREIAFEVLLSPEQRRQLDPVWQSLVRPVEWVGDVGRFVSRAMPFGGVRSKSSRRHSEGVSGETIADRGRSFFARDADRIWDRLCATATRSEAWECVAATLDDDDRARLFEGVELESDRVSRACQRAFEAFNARFEAEAKGMKIGLVSGAAGVIGAVVGGLVALPAGVTPVGAVIGATLAASTGAIGARSVQRFASLVIKTPELRALWDSIGEYRSALDAVALRSSEVLVGRCRSKSIETGDPLYTALERVSRGEDGS